MTLNMKILEERQEGYKEGQHTLIENMLKNGMSPEDISKNCDLPLSEVLLINDKGHEEAGGRA